jgi:hypothetical protein
MRSILLLCVLGVLTSTSFARLRDYDKRFTFALKLSQLRNREANKNEVLMQLGKPYSVVYTPAGNDFTETWLYSDRPRAKFPSLGTVVFNEKGRISKVMGDKLPSESICDLMLDTDAWMEYLASTPGLYSKSFKSKKVVEICSRLVRLPFNEAMTLLCEFARVRPKLETAGTQAVTSPRWDVNDGQLGILLLTLFDGDREMGRDVFPHSLSIKSQTDPKDKQYLGEVVIWNGWPVVIPSGHVQTSGWSYEANLLSIALKRKRFSYKPPSSSEPSFLDYRGLCTIVTKRLETVGDKNDFHLIFGAQLGMKTPPSLP